MYCSFPSIRNQKQFFSQASKSAKPRKNIALLRDPDISGNFSNKLDLLLSDDPHTNDVNEIESILTGAILKASESEVPKIELKTRKSPWANDEFLTLLKKRRACKDPVELKELGKSIKKLRNKLKNDYFSDLAENINTVAEARKVEEEFRLCKTYNMHKPTDTKLITSEKLTCVF